MRVPSRLTTSELLKSVDVTTTAAIAALVVTPQKPGGASRDRTDDPLLAKQVLSQLSYGP